MQQGQPSTKTIAAIAAAAFAVYLGIYYWPAIEGVIRVALSSLVPIILGFVLAYPLNILMGFYERHLFPQNGQPLAQRLRPIVSLVAAIASLAGIIAAVVVIVVPQLIDCVRLLIDELPVALASFGRWLEDTGTLTPETIDAIGDSLEAFDWKTGVGSAASVIMSGVVDVVAGVASGTANFVLAFVFALFILLSKDRLSRQANLVLERYLPGGVLVRLRYVLAIADDCFHRFLVGQCAEAAILGILCALGMLVLGLPHPWMIGALTAFMALIPIVGALLSGVIGAFLILMESPVQALIFRLFGGFCGRDSGIGPAQRAKTTIWN